MKKIILFSLILLISCEKKVPKKEAVLSKEEYIEKIKKKQVFNYLMSGKTNFEFVRRIFENEIILLIDSNKSNINKGDIRFKTFIDSEKGEYIPLFTSNEEKIKSTKSEDLGDEIKINGYLLLSQIMNNRGDIKLFRINPSLKDDIFIDIENVVKYFKEETELTIKALNKNLH